MDLVQILYDYLTGEEVNLEEYVEEERKYRNEPRENEGEYDSQDDSYNVHSIYSSYV